jgi:hypothetical protein
MAKKPFPTKRLLYKGAFYDVVDLPPTLMYKGAFYDAVQVSKFRFGAPRLPSKEIKGLEKLVKKYGPDAADEFTPPDQSVPDEEAKKGEEQRWTPNPEKKDKPEELQQFPFGDKKVILDALMPFSAQLVDEAKSMLSKYNIATSGSIVFAADEADGVDVSAEVATGGFSKIKDSKVIFDYSVNLPADYLEVVKSRLSEEGKGLADVERDGLVAKLVATLPIVKSIGWAQVSPKLQEVIFQFCKHGFAGSGSTVEELLRTVAYLQSVKDVASGVLLEVPVTDATEEQISEWAGELFKQIIENDMHQLAAVGIHRKADWGKKAFMSLVVRNLGEKNILGSDQVSALEKVIESLGSTEFAKFIREVLTPSAEGKRVSLQSKVEDAVKALTKHEKYTGDIKIGVHDDGNVVAAIDAPYPFQYIFRQPAGGKVKFQEAGVEICDFSFVVKSEESAKHLLTASLNLADAYKRAANPTLSQNRKERDMEELFLKIVETSKALEEQDLKEKAPTKEEALDVATPAKPEPKTEAQ